MARAAAVLGELAQPQGHCRAPQRATYLPDGPIPGRWVRAPRAADKSSIRRFDTTEASKHKHKHKQKDRDGSSRGGNAGPHVLVPRNHRSFRKGFPERYLLFNRPANDSMSGTETVMPLVTRSCFSKDLRLTGLVDANLLLEPGDFLLDGALAALPRLLLAGHHLFGMRERWACAEWGRG